MKYTKNNSKRQLKPEGTNKFHPTKNLPEKKRKANILDTIIVVSRNTKRIKILLKEKNKETRFLDPVHQ